MEGKLAKSVQVTRAGETIGILLEVEVTCDDLKGLEPGELLLVVGALEAEGAERVKLAIGRALTDAQDTHGGSGASSVRGGTVAHLRRHAGPAEADSEPAG